MDAYETCWRQRASEHGLMDVDWYVYNRGTEERYADLATAERRTLEINGEPYCGRGAQCSDICPRLCGRDTSGFFSAVDAILEDFYADDDEEA